MFGRIASLMLNQNDHNKNPVPFLTLKKSF
jgi:hypothetical protein